MALNIELRIDTNIGGYEQIPELHIPFPVEMIQRLNKMGKDGYKVYSIQADGDELEFIIKRFPNLPHTYQICRWHGEMANFIAANFPWR